MKWSTKANLYEKEESDKTTHYEYTAKSCLREGIFDSPKKIKLDDLMKLEGI